MDLFIKTDTKEQWIRQLKSNIKKWGVENGYQIPKKFILANRNTDKTEGVPLFILPPLRGDTMYDTFHSGTLRNICSHFGITDYVMTYSFPFIKDYVTVKDIKHYSVKIYQIIQLFNPKLIVILGEPAQNALLAKRYPLNVWHGMTVPNCEYKTMLLHTADYYCRRTKNEDKSFKAALRDNDWDNLKKEIGE